VKPRRVCRAGAGRPAPARRLTRTRESQSGCRGSAGGRLARPHPRGPLCGSSAVCARAVHAYARASWAGVDCGACCMLAARELARGVSLNRVAHANDNSSAVGCFKARATRATRCARPAPRSSTRASDRVFAPPAPARRVCCSDSTACHPLLGASTWTKGNRVLFDHTAPGTLPQCEDTGCAPRTRHLGVHSCPAAYLACH